MAGSDISAAFIKQFEGEVHTKYQQQGSLLRNTVRTKNNVVGKSTTFQIIGKGTASTKTRKGEITPMNLEHSNVEANLQDFYAGDWVDKLDELKTNIDERSAVAQAGAYALGRKTDELIIKEMDKATNEVDASTSGMTLAVALEAFAKLNEKDVPDDGQRFGLVSPLVWNQLLKIKEFSDSDYVNDKPFMKGKQCKNWLGINWIMHSGLTKSGDVVNCFLYHKTAVGHASGCDVTSDITWHGDHASHFINNMMSQGAILIDNEGIVKIKCKENPVEAAAATTEQGS